MGIRGKVSRNTLAHANQVRDWQIYADFAQILITRARRLYANDSFGIELNSLRVVFPAACGEFVIPAEAGIQKTGLDSASSAE
jgi:hypothetical protein